MTRTTASNGLLSDVTIVDLSTVIMGPFGSHILADLGADVIKIESPEGDSLRGYAPQRGTSMSGSFLNLNRNKRSVCLNLKAPAGRAALWRLLTTADVFLHNLRSEPIKRLGFDWLSVKAVNPELVYCAAYGFGAAGPYANKPAYDDIIQAGSGIAALYGRVHGEPRYAPTVICDKLAGQTIAYSILAALFHRERGGGGCCIEVPMFETAIEFNLIEHMSGFAFDPPLGPPGFARVLSPSRKPFRSLDGYVCLLPYSDQNWRDFYDYTGRREFTSDPRFKTLADRAANITELYQMVESEAARRTTHEWLSFCDGASIPAMAVQALEELPKDPHVASVGMFEPADHPTVGAYFSVRRPVSISGAPFEIRHHAPNLGEHTEEVLLAAGLSPLEIQAVVAEAAAPPKP